MVVVVVAEGRETDLNENSAGGGGIGNGSGNGNVRGLDRTVLARFVDLAAAPPPLIFFSLQLFSSRLNFVFIVSSGSGFDSSIPSLSFSSLINVDVVEDRELGFRIDLCLFGPG